MKILSDGTKRVESRRRHLAREILKRTYNTAYECQCGMCFQIEPLDIKFQDFVVDHKDIGVKCPHCKQWHCINYHIEWPANSDTPDRVLIYTIQEIRADKKKYKAALKKMKKDKSGGIKCLDSYME